MTNIIFLNFFRKYNYEGVLLHVDVRMLILAWKIP